MKHGFPLRLQRKCVTTAPPRLTRQISSPDLFEMLASRHRRKDPSQEHDIQKIEFRQTEADWKRLRQRAALRRTEVEQMTLREKWEQTTAFCSPARKAEADTGWCRGPRNTKLDLSTHQRKLRKPYLAHWNRLDQAKTNKNNSSRWSPGHPIL